MPTDNVHVLHTERPVNADAVAKLEKALAEARAGELVAVGIAGVAFDGSARTAFSTAENAITLLGSTYYLSARMKRGLLKE